MMLQHEPMETPVASSNRLMLVHLSLSTMYQYMYATMLSSSLGLSPAFGGAMFMSAQVAGALIHTLTGEDRVYLTRRVRAAFIALTALMLLCTVTLAAIYPVLWTAPAVWLTFAVVLMVSLRASWSRRLTARRMRRTLGLRAYGVLMAALELLPLAVMALVLGYNLPSAAAWPMWGGFAAGAALELYSLWRDRDLIALDGVPDEVDAQTVERMAAELRQANAYSAFQRMHTLILVALQLTLVMVYTFIGLTTRELLTCMLLCVGCTVITREVSQFVMRHVRRPFATELLLIGLFLWLYGLFLFYRQLVQQSGLVWSYLSLTLCVSGLTVSVTSLAELERRMTDVAQFQLKDHMRGYGRLRAASTELALLLGQMAALILLTVLCMPAGALTRMDLADVAHAFRPVMIVPPLLAAAGATISALRFPMNNRYFQKLARWLQLESEGKENAALRRQLDSVVVRRHKKRFGVKLIIFLLRPLYYHKVIGKENLNGYEDGSMILVCNHGEIYGPVVANLYVPIDFRPWVIANLTTKETIVEHVYQGTLMRQRWLPESWKRPLLKPFTPLIVWLFQSVDCIPVYRGQPRELMKTFRLTVEAMEAGDNILLFPENGEDHAPGEKGYVRDGVGKLYTGFAMIAPMYYAKTKKRAVFVPIYGSRKHRTLTIGKGIEYNPDANATQEKLRLVDELLSAMQSMAEKDA